MEPNIIEGKKLNMSQVFLETGVLVPVTVVTCSGDVSTDLEDKNVEVTGLSKGKGFTGVMKKWNFRGEMATRGQSNKPRSAGSIGSQTPSRVMKGKKMAGKHGHKQITIKGLKIVKVYPEKKEVLVSGPVPGAKNTKLKIKVL